MLIVRAEEQEWYLAATSPALNDIYMLSKSFIFNDFLIGVCLMLTRLLDVQTELRRNLYSNKSQGLDANSMSPGFGLGPFPLKYYPCGLDAGSKDLLLLQILQGLWKLRGSFPFATQQQSFEHHLGEVSL